VAISAGLITPLAGVKFDGSRLDFELAAVGAVFEGELQPDETTSGEIRQSGMSGTFHVRDGVKFHDGTNLTTEDVFQVTQPV
jgi:ABC-type transport system substrate-binding protein